MSFLDAYQDPALETDLTIGPDDITASEVARLQRMLATVVVTGSIPRRLSDATREELALDKKRARRVAHVLRQCLVAWGGEERAPDAGERIAGAQLDWQQWSEVQGANVSARIRHVATWAKRTGHLRFGKTAVVRLTQEVDWMSYALRD